MRTGVALCVAAAVVLFVARLDEALGLFDFRADENASLAYLERVYADGGIVLSRDVVEEAIARMPRDASYRVVVGRRLTEEHRFTRVVVADFLRYFLLPRRQVAGPAEWVFCYGCDQSALGDRFVVLADAGNGVLFGRIRT